MRGKSRKVISQNISELQTSETGRTRAKAIATSSQKRGINPREAKRRMSIAIALNKARRSGAKMPKV